MLPKIKSTRQVYLDYAATTPLDPRVKKAMEPFWREKFGNPTSLYKKGREAAEAIGSARKNIAQLINSRPEEIFFTAGGTESINLAIFGVARAIHQKNKKTPHIITTKIEHHAVLRSFEALEKEGIKTSYIDVDNQGMININKLKSAVRPETILISVMYANNEIGSIQPIIEIGKWLKQINTDRVHNGLTQILFHTDACQAAVSLDMNVQKLGVDLLSANSSKIYGPKQSGFLYVRGGVHLSPLIYGGGQERDLRSGTENVPGIVGLAKALELAQKDRLRENPRLIKLRDYFRTRVLKKIPKVVVNGPHQAMRLPNNINFSFSGVEGEALLLYLDSYGISVSTGSACSSADLDPSHVLLAIGRTAEQAQSSIRFTLGRQTKKSDLDYVLKILPELVKELRRVKRL